MKIAPVLTSLPGDAVRFQLWRLTDRFDLQMLVQSVRAVARGNVAKAVAAGERGTHDWTKKKAELLTAFDEAGITSAFMAPEHGGYIEGSKNTALGLIAFELAWVDAGAATSSLAGNLALSPIHEKGTPEQRDEYMRGCVPANATSKNPVRRGAFCLTEPIPFVGVDTGILCGKVRIAEWQDGKEPFLEIDKRGRFITNMGFADFVTAAVESDDPKFKGSCMVILEKDDPGLFDRGNPTHKFVHQLSSTTDPVFRLKVPAHRIIGGYKVKDGVIIPNHSHGEIIEAVFKRTRITVALMSSAKLLSAIEPIIRYQRGRFRGGNNTPSDSPRFRFGLQHKEDAQQRLLDVWATGEASASLGFSAARVFDDLDPIEKTKDELFAKQGIVGRAQIKKIRELEASAIGMSTEKRQAAVWEKSTEPMLRYVLLDSIANVLCPAAKLWNTGVGANMMREAVSLMGGYGITEDCPGYLGFKWIDCQLEATYEGPECVQRRQLSMTMTNELFLRQFEDWILDLEKKSGDDKIRGSVQLAAGMRLWQWTLKYLLAAKDAEGQNLYSSSRQAVSFAMADALCWLLAGREFLADVEHFAVHAKDDALFRDSYAGTKDFYAGLAAIQAARAASETARICSELVFGYQSSEESPEKTAFSALRRKADESLSWSRVIKDKLAKTLTEVMIPEVADY